VSVPPRIQFANILLAGPCNLRCPWCIGRQLPGPAPHSTLRRFPLPGLDRFLARARELGLTQVSLTGVNTDPLLYRRPRRLLARLRRRLPGVQVSLHTNGLLALPKMALVNRFDRVSLSLASLDPRTCRVMTGRPLVPDLARIVERLRVPLKVSVLVTAHNADQLPDLLRRLRELGIRRVVLRRLVRAPLAVGHARAWVQVRRTVARWPLRRRFGGNPVFDAGGLEVTLWDFERSTLRCLNLCPDGSLSTEYRLQEQR
jgi:MoaA/NifB/PqqE/SkfB family radical SAM enzyme